jgi:uncharacterized phage protein gp47/JayE
MYENMTFELILGRMLARIPDDVDKREGSVIYDSLAPAALELAQFYSALDDVIDETFADTAGREMLIRRAAERGIKPYPATFAIVKGGFNISVPLGSRFSLDDLRYRVTQRLSGNEYRLVCESIGAVGNRSVGDLIPVDYIEGLTWARITQLIIPGEDDEDTEHLRRRYFESLDTQSYGGNIADYRRMTLSIQGVGGVKVYPAFYGGGTVRLVIQDYQWGIPSQELVDEVKLTLDPIRRPGHGLGVVPIGHVVATEAVTGTAINVSAEFKMAQGYTFEEIKAGLDDILGKYLRELAVKWDSSDNLVVHASQIESRFLNENQSVITDIVNLRLNGGSGGRSIILSNNRIPLKGEITNVN